MCEAAQLANELERRFVDLLVRRRRLEVEQRLDVTAHGRRTVLQEAKSATPRAVDALRGFSSWPRCRCPWPWVSPPRGSRRSPGVPRWGRAVSGKFRRSARTAVARWW